MTRIDDLLPSLLEKGVITPVQPCEDQFVSPIFLEPKPDGSFRLILNLKALNKFLTAPHFKLEDSRTAQRLMRPNCFLATLDLKDAYYLVPVAHEHRKYLRFLFRERLFEFSCLPFGLCTAPLVFTKLMKPVVASLRAKGFLSILYLDDFLVFGDTFELAVANIAATCALLTRLGFLFSGKKCHFPPSQRCQYLGFVFDSRDLSMELPELRRTKVRCLVRRMEKRRSCTIRLFAQFLGSLSACCAAIPYGWAYTKQFERDKFLALRRNGENFDAVMSLPRRPRIYKW